MGGIIINTVINNLNINYIKQGTGDPILILPGWGTTINTYTTLIESVSKYRTVYCIDMPGFGQSEEPKKSLNLDDFVDLVIKFIENQNISEIDLIGHSNGGRIIIKLMSRNLKFKVGKIILIGSAGIVHEKTQAQKMKLGLIKVGKKILGAKPLKKIMPDMETKLKNKLGSEDYRNASPIMKETMVKLINEDLQEYLPNIKAPTLLIWGENDTATPISDAEIMEKKIPDAGLVKVPYCSHYVFIERAEYVNNIIKIFIEGSSK